METQDSPQNTASSPLRPPTKFLSVEFLEKAKQASSATISWELNKRGFRFVYMAGVLPLKAGSVFSGRAYTLRYLPRREDHPMFPIPMEARHLYPEHVAVESVGPGDVLVVSARGNVHAGIFGDRLVARMHFLGAAGLVTDGAIRDVPYLRDQDFPVFVRAPHGYGHMSEHWAADVQLPVDCGNVTVYPGDLLVGDDDGVVVCPQAIAEEVIEGAIAQEVEETFTRTLLEEGYTVNQVHGDLPPDLQARYQQWRRSR